MDAEKYYIDKMQWESVIKEWLRQFEIIAPHQETGGLFLETVQRTRLQAIVYHLARPVQPLLLIVDWNEDYPRNQSIGHWVRM